MSKGNYQRKLRSIDYTKKEIADQLHVVETTVDSRIAQLCKDYDLPVGIFKRDGDKGLNFFPPEYTPFLIELLKHNSDNPAMPRARKHEKVTAEAVVEYNRKMMESIEANAEIPQYMKEWIKVIPWGRSANDISELLNLLVTELQVFIHNTLDMQNVDVGQALRMIISNLDVVNYRMYQGNQLYRMALTDQNSLKEEAEDGLYEDCLYEDCLYEDLSKMGEEEREQYFQEIPESRAIYNHYLGERKDEKITKLDAKDMSIDQGMIATILELMRKGDANQLKKGIVLDLKEYQPSSNESELSVNGKRREYLKDMEPVIKGAIEQGVSSGQIDFISKSGKKWKCIADKIKDNEKIGSIEHPGGIEKFCDLFEQRYLEMFEKIRTNDTELKNIVSNFVGRLMVDFFFASNKK